MLQFDLYINTKKPTLGLYVRKGAGLPDLVNPSQWQFEGHVWQSDISTDVLKGLEANGHAFQEMAT